MGTKGKLKARKCHESLGIKRNNETSEKQGVIMKDYLEYKGYKGSVDYSKEDDCLCGKVIGMNKDIILYEGSTLEELRDDFQNAVDDYIAGCLADGIEPRKPFSGKMILRMSHNLHERIAMSASASGTSINEYLIRTLEECVPTYGRA